MHGQITRVFVVVAASAALSTLGVAAPGVSGAATLAPQTVRASSSAASHPAAIPGAQLWVKRYNGPGNSVDEAASVAASPAGGRVFVTGESAGAGTRSDYATVAYDAVTGARLWAMRYNGPGNSFDHARSAVASPDGQAVFVTGASVGTTLQEDYPTVAYNAATGAQLWARRYNGPGLFSCQSRP